MNLSRRTSTDGVESGTNSAGDLGMNDAQDALV